MNGNDELSLIERLPIDTYHAFQELFFGDFPEGMIEALEPREVLKSSVNGYVDITVFTRFSTNFRRYDKNTNQVCFSVDSNDFGLTKKPGTDAYKSEMYKRHQENQSAANYSIIEANFPPTIDSIFGFN